MSDLSVTLAEARDLFLEADFEQAAEKFRAAKTAAVAAGDADAAAAADTGLAEVSIQQKQWEPAVKLLESALANPGAKPVSLVRARYMLGLARMVQGRAVDARGEFEAALDVARVENTSAADTAGLRGDVEDRLAQLDELESLEEEDLLEIAMEFGASAASDEYGPGGEEGEDDEEDEDEEEDDEEEDEHAQVTGVRATGVGFRHADEDEEDEEDEGEEEEEEDFEGEDVDEDDEEEEEAEAEAEAAAAAAGSPRKRKAAAGDGENGAEEKRAKPAAAAPVPNGDLHDAEKKV